MKILLDVMGGDNAPLALLEGAAEASKQYDADLVLVGDEEIIKKTVREERIDLSSPHISVVHAPQVITMEDAPLCVVREKNRSSMTVGLKMLSEGKGDAFVSAGNTGALHAGSTLIVRRIRGIGKSAIGSVLPFKNPTLLLDSGANLELKPEAYVQLAEMGTVYMNRILGVTDVRVGLVNIGTEETKGSRELQEAYRLLKEREGIHFVGNIEGRDIPFGKCDVLLADGFTGNLILKLSEGLGSFLFSDIKEVFSSNLLTRASALMVKKDLKQMKKRYDSAEYGGAPLLGLSRPVLKAHGSSDARAVCNAVGSAIRCVEQEVTYEIARRILPDMEKEGGAEGGMEK